MLSSDAKQEILASIEFFQGCTQDELREVAHLAGERELPVGAELCTQNDFGNDVFVIVEGEADVIIDGTVTGRTRVHEIVGELSMLGTGRRAATLSAVTPLCVLVLDPREIDSVLMADPPSARLLTQHGEQAPGS